LVCASCGHENPDGNRFCAQCGAALGGGSGERRKVVTVLFCDLAGSTALGEQTDPEALRALLGRYFERMSGIVESHGGTVEKFIGDAVMAVFGVPQVHEDDALRACRAAVEMREALPDLGIQGRIGVNTGEVVTGTAERLVTGDTVNVAARFEQAAAPGEVLIGETTHELVQGAVDAEPVEPLALKGKSEPVAAFRLLSAHAAPERRHDSTFVGRKRQLRLLSEAWERAAGEQSCELVTVVGEPGIGKSRLAAEALTSVGARVVRGRCLPYGAGITYWPVVEVVKQLDLLPTDPAAAAAIRSLLGESDAGTSAEEIGWAFRKLLEEHAPLVVVLDDIQWGEQTFLDLIEHVALLSSGASLLLLCMARPELLDSRPTWPVTIRLEPLDDADTESLIGAAVSEGLRSRITAAAAGNPLFISEMLAMTQEAGGDVEVPPSLKALLSARLDQLDPAERRVLECGSVEGEVFHRSAVQTLAPDETQVTPRLAGLVRRELIRSDRPQFAGEDGFRFRHLLIRDTAYDALPKSVRADLHRRFAAWLEQRGDLVELDEIVGYHLEQAARYLIELGRPDPSLAEEASGRLSAAGERARWRGDGEAAHSLLGRAVKLVERPGLHLEVAFAMSHFAARDSERLLEEAAQRADGRADATGAALARGLAGQMRLWTGEGSVNDAEELGLAALPLLEERRDHVGLAQMWFALAFGVYNYADRFEQIVHAAEMARTYETLAGQPHHRSDGLRAMALAHGPRPVDEVLGTLDALDSSVRVDLVRADLLAMSDRIDDARALLQATAERARESGQAVPPDRAGIESFSGNHAVAAEQLDVRLDWEHKRGITGNVAFTLAWQSRELALAGRHEEAEQRVAQAREHPNQAPYPQAVWRQAAALVHASRGEHEEAEMLARGALMHVEKTDSLSGQADAYSDLAQVLETAGRHDEAAAAYRQALDLYERKQIIPLARRTRERLAALQAPTA
jgi:class 3 adenylate cyclase/tetratricopeptide (TPR) repeat protein